MSSGLTKPAPPRPDCRTCGGSGEDAYGQRCVCTYNRDRAGRQALKEPTNTTVAETCHADRDGDCRSPNCPQLRDGEPARSGRHCPLDIPEADDE